MKKTRSSNFELMRIISILFIILGHILLHGHVIANAQNTALINFLNFVMCVLLVHVNSYILVFGYFQSNSWFKLSKLIRLFSQVIFYSIIILVISIKLNWVSNYTIVNFIENVIPSCISNYWFINSYIIIYIFSDKINLFIGRLTKEEYKSLLILLFIMLSIMPYVSGLKFINNNGYNSANFLLLYLIGAYINRYPIKESYHFKNMSLNGYRLFLIFVFLFMAILNYIFNYFAFSTNGASNLSSFISNRILASNYSYSSPLVIIQSLAFFELFRTITIKSKIINIISANVFGIYLFHDHEYIRNNIYKILKIDNGVFYGYRHIVYVIYGMLLIFFAGWVIEFLRKNILKLFCKTKIYKKITHRATRFINSFNFKINI